MITETHITNNTNPITKANSPPLMIKGKDTIKKGRKFHMYKAGSIKMNSGSTPRFSQNSSAGLYQKSIGNKFHHTSTSG